MHPALLLRRLESPVNRAGISTLENILAAAMDSLKASYRPRTMAMVTA